MCGNVRKLWRVLKNQWEMKNCMAHRKLWIASHRCLIKKIHRWKGTRPIPVDKGGEL
jgi:hypothetical protein